MKNTILIVSMNLYNGGAERSLVNLLNEIDYSLYSVDLLLFQKKGMFLEQLPKEVNILNTPKELYYLYNRIDRGIFKKFLYVKIAVIRVMGSFIINLNKGDKIRKKRQLRWKNFYKNVLPNFTKSYRVALAYLECEPTYYVIDKITALHKAVWVHNDYEQTGLDKSLDLPYMEKANTIVSISDECVKILKKVFPKQASKCFCIPNLISDELIKRRAKEKIETEYQNEKFKILSIGRLNEQKGFDLAIEAASMLKDSGIDFQWIIIGTGKLYNTLNIMINKYNLDGYVYLVGAKTNPYPYILKCDILTQTSRFEGKSVVLDEAKILKKPILATRYTTVYDQVSTDFGFVVDMDSKSIYEGLKAVFYNRSLLTEREQFLEKQLYGNIDEIKKYYEIFNAGREK